VSRGGAAAPLWAPLWAPLCALACGCDAAARPVLQPDGVVRGAVGARLDRYMRAIADSGFSGVLLVADDSGIVVSRGYGAADRRTRAPFTERTVVDVASVTKQFTAAAILTLEMRGRSA
jgi:CubicO group peptidase (beta-lactamase class C family)